MRTSPPQMKLFLAVDPVGPLMIDAPAIAPKQDMHPPVSVPDPRFRDLTDPDLEQEFRRVAGAFRRRLYRLGNPFEWACNNGLAAPPLHDDQH